MTLYMYGNVICMYMYVKSNAARADVSSDVDELCKKVTLNRQSDNITVDYTW